MGYPGGEVKGVGEWMDGWMDGWMHGCTDKQRDKEKLLSSTQNFNRGFRAQAEFGPGGP